MTGLANNVARYVLSIDGSSDPWTVVRWHGTEWISALFQFEVEATGEGVGNPASLIGKTAVLTVLGLGDPRFIHGIVSSVYESPRSLRQRRYEITIVPRVFRLLHAHDCRIFQQKSVPDIVRDVLRLRGIQGGQVQFSLQCTYTPRDYCVQYRESDWAFISRLLEEEGIFYYFDHTEGEHTLVFADKPQAHVAIEGDPHLLLTEATGLVEDREHVRRFRFGARIGTGKVTLQDFDFTRPALNLQNNHQGAAYTDLEAYDYPGEYDAPAGGRQLARVRLEEQAWQQQGAHGESICPRLMAGRKFTLEEHEGQLRDELLQDYVVTAVHHRGEHAAVISEGNRSELPEYTNDFEALPASVTYRPVRVTPRPIVQGVQTAIVVGPGEIHTDAHGRVKVHFHWDRLGGRDEHSSCWIRVSQAWAGEGWGFMAIPRVGHEVVVSFLEGDPDRPLITGRVYHGTNTPPYELPGNATRTTLKSNSSPGGGGFNELRFEDAAGSEEIYMHAQKDWNNVIRNDKTQDVGHDETLHVVHDRSKTVDHDQHEHIGHDKTIQVDNDHTETINGNATVTIEKNHHEEVHQNRTEAVTQNQSLDVGGNSTTKVHGNLSLTVMQAKTEHVLIASAETVGAAKSTTVGGAYSITVGATMSTSVVGSLGTSSGGATQIAAKGNLSIGTSSDATIDAKKKLTMHSKEDMGIHTDKKLSIESKEDLSVKTEKKAVIDGADEITIKCGDATVVLKKNGDVTVKGGKITVEGSGDIKIKGSKVGIN